MRRSFASLSARLAIGLLPLSYAGAAIAAPPVWSPPRVLTPAGNTSPVSQQMAAINAAGQILSVWVQGATVQARMRAGGTWGLPTELTQAGTTSAGIFDVAEAATGDAVVAYTATAATAPATYRTRFYSAGVWGPAVAVPATTGATVLAARARFDGTGKATLVWTEQTGGMCSVRASVGTAASGWGAPAALGSGCFSFMQLAVNKGGEAALALGTPPPAIRHGGSPAIVTSRNAAGSWTAFTDLGSGPYGTPPSVGMGDNGAAIALFSDANFGVRWSRRSPTDGSWSAPAILDGGVPAVPTAVAVAASGHAVAVYNTYYTVLPPSPLLAATLRAGSNNWSTPTIITDPNGTIDNFQATATPAGSFVIGWTDVAPSSPVGAGSSMGVSVLPAGGTWSITTLDADLANPGMSPSPYATVVAAATGKAVAVWNTVTAAGRPLVKMSTTAVK